MTQVTLPRHELIRRRSRLLARGWLVQVKYLSSTGYFVLISTVQPVVFATIAYYLLRASQEPAALVYAAVGAGMLSLWGATLSASGRSLMQMRIEGMLELLVAAPAPFPLVLASVTLATATIGLYGLTTTLAWGWLIFDIPLHVEHPWLLLAAVPATVFGLGMLGMVLASVFVRLRYANAMTNLFDYPIWILSGLLVPVDLLPEWARPLSLLLPSMWGGQAIRDSLLGGQPVFAICACVGLGVGYLGLALFTIRKFEMLARRRASLALT